MAFLVSPRAIPRYIDQYGYAFSWKRLWNAGKVLMSMGISWATGRVVVWGRPFMMMVEPTNICNLKCPLCPSGNGEMTRTRGKMGLEDFKRLVDEAGDYLVLLMLWNQGEPFINTDFVEMVRYAHSRRIPTLTSTNGHYIRDMDQARAIVDSGLDELILSNNGVILSPSHGISCLLNGFTLNPFSLDSTFRTIATATGERIAIEA